VDGGQAFSQILEAARRGSDEAWAEIYRELAPRVLGYVRARGAQDPEDLLGEVFLRAVRDIGAFRGGERELRAWVLTIAHHRLVDDLRRRARRPQELGEDTLDLDRGLVGDVEEEALGRIGAERVRELIRGLTEEQQSVLLLRILGDLTIEEVARAIGKRPGAVKALQRRALRSIKERLAREGVTL
jgi:RNA polymerase sigma-70 factor (ECF subfamily)